MIFFCLKALQSFKSGLNTFICTYITTYKEIIILLYIN